MAILDKRLLYATTLINTKSSVGQSIASGFFYMIEGEEAKDNTDNYWLVTNRHVVYNKDAAKNEILIDSLSFFFRYEDKITGSIKRFDVTLDKSYILANVKVHTDKNVDVAVINIIDKLNEALASTPPDDIMYLSPVTDKQLPEKSKYPIEVCDDSVCIGYPKGFYDDANLFPTVKSGIIASEWNAKFKGDPLFLIDLQLFPGSSGSLVITKPRMDSLDESGHLIWRKEKEYYFLVMSKK